MAVNKANVAIPSAMLAEMMAVVGMANQTNALASGSQNEVDAAFLKGWPQDP